MQGQRTGRASLHPTSPVCVVQERCHAAEYSLAMKTEECKRLQEQQTAFAALVSTLEADLSAANGSMTDVRSMVMENSHAMKEQKAWIQQAMVREERLVGERPTNVALWLHSTLKWSQFFF